MSVVDGVDRSRNLYSNERSLQAKNTHGIYKFLGNIKEENPLNKVWTAIKKIAKSIFIYLGMVYNYLYNRFNTHFKHPRSIRPQPLEIKVQIPQKKQKISEEKQLPADASIQPNEMSAEDLKEAAEILKFSWSADAGDALQMAEDSALRRLGETISQGQGCQKLRQQVVRSTKKAVQAISPAALRAASNEQNQRQYQILKYKRLAHTLGFKEEKFKKLYLPTTPDENGRKQLQLQCFNETFTMPMLRASLDNFFASSPGFEKQRVAFSKIFANSLCHDNASDENIEKAFNAIHSKENDLPVLIGTGWDWHSTQLIIFKDYFIYCNRGADCDIGGLSEGWHLFKIGKKENITKEWIGKVTKRISTPRENYKSRNNIISDLEGKLIYSHYAKSQKVGSCTMNSLKAAISALFALDELTDSFEKKISEKEIAVKLSSSTWKRNYKKFSSFDRKLLLKDFLIDLNGVSPDDNIKTMAYLLHHKLTNSLSIGFRIGWKLWLEVVNQCEYVTKTNRPISGELRQLAEELAGTAELTPELFLIKNMQVKKLQIKYPRVYL